MVGKYSAQRQQRCMPIQKRLVLLQCQGHWSPHFHWSQLGSMHIWCRDSTFWIGAKNLRFCFRWKTIDSIAMTTEVQKRLKKNLTCLAAANNVAQITNAKAAFDRNASAPSKYFKDLRHEGHRFAWFSQWLKSSEYVNFCTASASLPPPYHVGPPFPNRLNHELQAVTPRSEGVGKYNCPPEEPLYLFSHPWKMTCHWLGANPPNTTTTKKVRTISRTTFEGLSGNKLPIEL